jgi:hypothetical protein
MKYPIDFTRTYDFSQSWAIIDAPKIVNSDRLSKLPYTNERALCAVTFVGMLAYKLERDSYKAYQQGFLRASLAEFVGMEEALPLDLSSLGIALTAKRLSESPSPLLRSIRELRHMRIHVICNSMTTAPNEVVYLEKTLNVGMFLVQDWTEEKFEELRNSRHYDEKSIKELVGWFNEAQRHFGIQDLVIRAVQEYASDIIGTYSL